MSFDARLEALGLELPAPPKPVASYIPAVRSGHLLFLSGMLPFRNGQLTCTGKVGRELTTDQGSAASRTAVLNALAVARQELGTLDRINKVVRMVGHVASAEGFGQQPAVINGASDLLVQIFGDAGRHARVAIGVAELPLNAPVELELILEVG
ncbi:MAG TPA: RidA family protein [Nitrospiraceae bacterium]|nr:RidA family protein [Nitrospiraceae bacterium]